MQPLGDIFRVQTMAEAVSRLGEPARAGQTDSAAQVNRKNILDQYQVLLEIVSTKLSYGAGAAGACLALVCIYGIIFRVSRGASLRSRAFSGVDDSA
jgi:hypothetical protein